MLLTPLPLFAALLSAATPAPAPVQMPSGYRTPPEPIASIIAAAPTPLVSVSPTHRTMALFGRESLPSIAHLSKPILRLAGYRLDPATNGPVETQAQWLNALSFQDLATGTESPVRLPAGTRFIQPKWSPDGKRLALVVQRPDGLDLWVAERDGSARLLVGGLNAAMSTPFQWLPGTGQGLASNTPGLQFGSARGEHGTTFPSVPYAGGSATLGQSTGLTEFIFSCPELSGTPPSPFFLFFFFPRSAVFHRARAQKNTRKKKRKKARWRAQTVDL